jgi:tetratricopeptide (TPR) repeat protein
MNLRSTPFTLPVRRWAVLLMLLCSWGARADNNPTNITPGEVALLPEYCKDAQGFGYGDASFNTSPRAGYWLGLMGKTFWAVHHQCWALIREHRSRAAGLSRQERDGHIRGAVGDYMYVINYAEPEFILLPELYTQVGEAHLLLGDVGAAFDAFTAARKRKPDYWPPYVAWARVLMKSGKRQEALAHVESVMRLVPGDPELKRQYNLLKSGPASDARAAKTSAHRVGTRATAMSRGEDRPRAASATVTAAGAKPFAASAASR